MKMLINGGFADAGDGGVLEVFNPYNRALLDTVPAATQADVDLAVDSAVQAQRAWAAESIYVRSEIIKKFAALIDEHLEDLAQTLTAEVGKPINAARGELECARDTFRSFAEKFRHINHEIIPAGRESGTEKTVLVTVREPLGVIACVIPFNFPARSFSVKVAPAVIAGNAVIVKPASDAPLTLLKLGELMGQAGIPTSVFQIVTGSGAKVGAWLCGNKQVRGITLTGSTEVGITAARTARSIWPI